MKLQLFDQKKLRQPKESKLFQSLIPTFKEKRTQQFTTLALTFITMAFFGLFAISPTLGTIADLQKQIDDSTFVHDSMQEKIANLTTLQGAYAALQPDLKQVMDAVPDSPNIDIFVGQLHTIASNSQVQVDRVQTFPVEISSKTTQSQYTSYTFSVEIEGNYSNIQQFISNLGNFNRLVVLDELVLTQIGKLDNSFRLSVRGRTYFKQD